MWGDKDCNFSNRGGVGLVVELGVGDIRSQLVVVTSKVALST